MSREFSLRSSPPSSVYGSGFVHVQELGVGLEWLQTAVEVNTTGGPYEYGVQLGGLLPLSLYGITAITSYSKDQCLVYEASHAKAFLTSNGFGLTEQDFPYDSVSQVGGGAQVGWQLSPSLVSAGTLLNGTVAYWNNTLSSQTVVVPIASGTEPYRTGDSFQFNVTPANPNQGYTVQVELNYSVDYQGSYGTFTGTFEAVSQALPFVYLRDSTGDGLTDAEKWAGWIVPVPNAPGGYLDAPPGTVWVDAAPWLYATNRLVSDYVEKEFDLDPNTGDTAGSQMLDTWNLTFNLGSTPLPPAKLEYWNESGSYNPFTATNCGSTGCPVAQNISNITPTAARGPTSGDGSPWAAEALWSRSSLNTFLNLTGVVNARAQDGGPLRAVSGTDWNGNRTITVWGKLSWGANPLVASTVSGWLMPPDGNRVDPVATRALLVSSLWANSTGLNSSTGWAVQFTVRNGTTKTGSDEFQAYSQPALGMGGSQTQISNYSVAIPVSQIYQNQTIQVKVIANLGGILAPLAFNGVANTANITMDMLYGGLHTYAQTIGTGSKYAQLGFKVSWVRTGLKAPTYLWVPTANGTTNGLPAGSERYIGEQAFDLVVVNVSSSISLSGVPYPWGGSYSVSLSPGLNNLLVPREQFLNSTFGEAILRGIAAPYSVGANPAMITNSSPTWYSIHGFGGANLLTDLASYWQNRAIWNSVGAIDSTTETGTPDKSSQSIHALAVDSATPPANNTGSDPSDPALENSATSGAALQAVLTLNVTNSTQLQLLMAGLLDNATGGVNGTFQSVALQVRSLGLAAPVLSALANQAVLGQGLYSAPKSALPAQTSPSSSLWGAFWNSFTAVTSLVSGAIGSLLETAWSITLAAFTYINHLYRAALALGGALLNRTVAALQVAGRALVNATKQLLGAVLSLVESILTPVTKPITTSVNSYGTTTNNSLTVAYSQVQGGSNVSSNARLEFWQAADGSVFLFCFGLGIALTVAATATTPLDFGPMFLVGVVATLLAVALTVAGAIPRVTGFSSVGVATLEGFLSTFKGLAAIFTSTFTSNTLTELAAGTSLVAALLSFELLAAAAPGVWNKLGASIFIGISFLGLILDSLGFISGSPLLLLFAMVCSLTGACVTLSVSSQNGGVTAALLETAGLTRGISFAIELSKALAYET